MGRLSAMKQQSHRTNIGPPCPADAGDAWADRQHLHRSKHKIIIIIHKRLDLRVMSDKWRRAQIGRCQMRQRTANHNAQLVVFGELTICHSCFTTTDDGRHVKPRQFQNADNNDDSIGLIRNSKEWGAALVFQNGNRTVVKSSSAAVG